MWITLMRRRHQTDVLLMTIHTVAESEHIITIVCDHHETMRGLNLIYKDRYLVYFTKIVLHATLVVLCFRIYSRFGYCDIILLSYYNY